MIVSHKPIMIAAAAPLPVAIQLWMARQEQAAGCGVLIAA
jgi:hypothetical protein